MVFGNTLVASSPRSKSFFQGIKRKIGDKRLGFGLIFARKILTTAPQTPTKKISFCVVTSKFAAKFFVITFARKIFGKIKLAPLFELYVELKSRVSFSAKQKVA